MKSTRECIAALLLICSGPAMATGTTAGFEMGGRFARFDPVINQYNQSGELFRIGGRCQSACTMFLGIRNVCVSRDATLLFHAGSNRTRVVSASATEHVLAAYNAKLRAYLMSNHYMDTLEYRAISGRDLIDKFGYRECPRK